MVYHHVQILSLSLFCVDRNAIINAWQMSDWGEISPSTLPYHNTRYLLRSQDSVGQACASNATLAFPISPFICGLLYKCASLTVHHGHSTLTEDLSPATVTTNYTNWVATCTSRVLNYSTYSVYPLASYSSIAHQALLIRHNVHIRNSMYVYRHTYVSCVHAYSVHLYIPVVCCVSCIDYAWPSQSSGWSRSTDVGSSVW